jgi:hypothetical protein
MKTVSLAYFTLLFFAAVSGPGTAAETTRFSGLVNYVESSGSVLVNGVPAAEFSAGEGGSGGNAFELTDWLVNGTNEIVLTVEPVSDHAKATLELGSVASPDPMLTLEQVGQGTATGTLEVDGLPDWSWTGATRQDEAAAGLVESVTGFHAAFRDADLDRIVAISGPFLADQKHLGGLDETILREQLGPVFKVARLLDLPELTIASYQGGKLFRVTGPEGNPPVNLEFESDGMSGAVRAGEWWCFVDGEWRVVR